MQRLLWSRFVSRHLINLICNPMCVNIIARELSVINCNYFRMAVFFKILYDYDTFNFVVYRNNHDWRLALTIHHKYDNLCLPLSFLASNFSSYTTVDLHFCSGLYVYVNKYILNKTYLLFTHWLHSLSR